jgi:hypothetical protein
MLEDIPILLISFINFPCQNILMKWFAIGFGMVFVVIYMALAISLHSMYVFTEVQSMALYIPLVLLVVGIITISLKE